MSDFLTQLAMESIEESGPAHDEFSHLTVSDLIEEYSEGTSPNEMIEHAHDAREVAEDLKELATRAEAIADADERHAHYAVESLQREFAAIIKSNKLPYKAHSFESALLPMDRATGLAKDCLRTAEDLEMNADAMTSLSQEVRVFDFLTNKDNGIKKSKILIQKGISNISSNAKALSEHGVPIIHKGVSRFLSAGGKDVRDIKGAVEHDFKYLQGVEKFVKERIDYLSKLNAKSAFKEGNVSDVVTNPDSLGSAKAGYYPLLGNHGVIELGKFQRVEMPGLWGKGWDNKFKFFLGAIGNYLSFTPGSSRIAAAGTITAGAIGWMAAGSLLATAISDKTRESILNDSKLISTSGIDEFKDAVKSVLEMEKFANTDTLYNQLSEVEEHLKSLKAENKDLYKKARNDLDRCSAALSVMKDHAWYVMVQTAKMIEQIEKHIK